MELGPRDVKNHQAILVRRDTGEKIPVPEATLPDKIGSLLTEIQQNLYQKALHFTQENTCAVETSEDFYRVMESQRGFVKAYWCGDSACEDAIQTKSTATLRCIPLEEDTSGEGRFCVQCGKPALALAYWAKAY